jgi:competence protein ComEA
MGRNLRDPYAGLTGATRASHRPANRSIAMKAIAVLIKSLAFSLLLSTTAFAAGKVDINRASASELAAALNGVGEAKAQAIVEHREKNGPFKSADQLADVRGIGLATIEKNRELIQVGNAAPIKQEAGKQSAE